MTRPSSTTIEYALERLFVDQERDWVHDTIAPVLAWVPGQIRATRTQPFRFEIDHDSGRKMSKVYVDLHWDPHALERAIPGVQEHANRLRTGRSAQREHVTELAAYGLAFVAVDLAEIHLSLWCATPQIGTLERING